MSRRTVTMDFAVAAGASLLAGWVMNQVTTAMYEREDPGARKREEDARGGKTAPEITAEKAAALAGRELSDEQRKRLGALIHRSLGFGAGAVYSILWHALPGFRAGSGVAFGVLHFLLLDEGANTILGITPPPQNFPWQAHARGLVGHIAFGATLETVHHLYEIAQAGARR